MSRFFILRRMRTGLVWVYREVSGIVSYSIRIINLERGLGKG